MVNLFAEISNNDVFPYRLASLPSSWWRYFYRTAFHLFPRKTLSKWVQELSSNCSAVLASCLRTNMQSGHQPLWRVSCGSSLRKLVPIMYVIIVNSTIVNSKLVPIRYVIITVNGKLVHIMYVILTVTGGYLLHTCTVLSILHFSTHLILTSAL